MQKIIPHLWYDKEAKEAIQFYTSLFPNSKINTVTTLHNTPSGDSDIVSFTLWGYEMMAISAGPYFKLNPSISFMVNFDPAQDTDAKTRIDEVWKKLIVGGTIRMPMDKYPFSEQYGWVEDKYGLNWQLILTDPKGEKRPFIIPSMLFVKDKAGKTEEATNFYMSIFKNSKRGAIAKYPAGMTPEKEGEVMFTDFMLENQWFVAMDSRQNHEFMFNEAFSFLVQCKDQKEMDELTEKLSAVPESEQCGWVKDKYGVSWQISSKEMEEMMQKGTQEQIDRMTKAFLPMKRLNLAEIKKAFEGK